MPAQQTVTRSLNQIKFSGKLNAEAIPLLLGELRSAKFAGFEEASFDFSHCTRAFTNGIVPLAALASKWQSEGFNLEIVLPNDKNLARLFENTGLAHFIDPNSFDVSTYKGLSSVRIRQFQSHQDQFGLVDAFMDTIVDVQINKSPTFKVSDALGFTGMIGGVFDTIEAKYETDNSNEFMLKLLSETTGFGSRGAGQQIRTKCLNILTADTGRPLVLDWSGVPIISSSFADEAIGKLFVELGPINFSTRVKNIGLDPLVRGLIEKAILQRASEASKHFTSGNKKLENIKDAAEGQLPE